MHRLACARRSSSTVGASRIAALNMRLSSAPSHSILAALPTLDHFRLSSSSSASLAYAAKHDAQQQQQQQENGRPEQSSGEGRSSSSSQTLKHLNARQKHSLNGTSHHSAAPLPPFDQTASPTLQPRNSASQQASMTNASTARSPTALTQEQLLIPELFPRSQVIDLPRPKQTAEPGNGDPLEAVATVRALSKIKLGERLALVYACLETGNVDRAELVFNRCWRTNPADVRAEIQTTLVNRFIATHLMNQRSQASGDAAAMGLLRPNSFLQQLGHEQRALDWLRKLDELGLVADNSTYALLCDHYLKAGNSQRVKEILQEMISLNMDPLVLLEHDLFTNPEDSLPLKAVMRSAGIQPPQSESLVATNSTEATSALSSNDAIDDLLLSALDDTMAVSQTDGQTQALATDPSSQEQTHSTSSSSLHNTQEQAVRQNEDDLEADRAQSLLTTDASGVRILRSTLASIRQVSQMEKYNQQLWLEERSYAAALEQHQEFVKSLPPDLRRMASLPTELMSKWFHEVMPLIRQKLESIVSNTVDAESEAIGPFLQLVSPEKLARITISEFLKAFAGSAKWKEDTKSVYANQVRAVQIMSSIGRSIEREHNMEQMKKKRTQKAVKMEMGIHKLHTSGRMFDLTVRKVATEMAKNHSKLNDTWRPDWGSGTKVQIGALLSGLLIQAAKISVQSTDPTTQGKATSVEVPAFEHKLIWLRDRNVGHIEAHPALMDLVSNGAVHIAPIHLPMLVKPRPWLTPTTGGYLQHRSELMRIHTNPEHEDYLKAADDAGHLTICLRALDVLGSTAWTINTPVYRVAAILWNKGEAAPKMPSAIELPPTPKPDDYDTNPEAKKKYKIAESKRMRETMNNYSQRCSVNYKLEIAKSFLGETIYFPHNMDFRGRAYPMPPHLNHIGDDLCRGLLTFKEARPLGKDGMRWLKIQAANLAGFDKASLSERVAFAENHMSEILDSAARPLDGNRWWMKADSPWQLLATCIEINEALKCENPETFLSSLPIHQDGSCNGLQHYAALGGDLEGARVVNLIASDRPQDVYTSIAKQVMKLVSEDVEQGVAEAKLVENRITRKVVKQTVMTNTYGVTFIGARAQVLNRLREARASENPATALTDEQMFACSHYITKRIFDSLGTIFEGARRIQLWLNVTARAVAKSIPIEDIPQNQLDDTKQLAEMGLLPNIKISDLIKEELAAEHELFSDPTTLHKKSEDAVDDDLLLLENAAVEEAKASSLQATAKPSKNAKAALGESAQEDPLDESFGADLSMSFDDAWSKGLAEKQPIKIQKGKSAAPAKMTSVIWTTPLGLPVVQPYRNFGMTTVKTELQTFTIVDAKERAPVNPQKQSTAFPPNFVHSLDASHMMLTAIACQARNIEFASVHDSFWTHASNVDEMGRILRDAFVRLHSENIIERLRNELITRYKTNRVSHTVTISGKENIAKWNEYLVKNGRPKVARGRVSVTVWSELEIEELPGRGKFNVADVRGSPYFFH